MTQLRARLDDITARPLAPVGRASTILALLAAGAVNGACYSYVPVRATAAPTEDVRIEITPSAARRLAGDLGVFSTELDGRLASERRDSLSVHVPIERQYRGMAVGTTDQVIQLGASEVVVVRTRQFSPARTTLLVAGIGVGFGALAAGITQLLDQNQNTDQTLTPPPPSGSTGATASRAPTRIRLGVRIPVP